jgi:hypothetical protein
MFTSTFVYVRKDPDDVVNLVDSVVDFLSDFNLEALINDVLAPESKRIFN